MRSEDIVGRGSSRLTTTTIDWDADHVRALRTHLRMTQEELAALLGTRQQTISEWEIGKHRPRGTSVTLLTRLAESSGFSGVNTRLAPVSVYAGR